MSEFRRRLLVQSKNNNPILNDYLTIVALEDGLTAKLSVNACEYCVDGDGNWKTLPADTETEVINTGQTLSFRGNLTPTSSDGIGTFTVNRYFNLRGNCMSILFGDDGKYCFSLSGKGNAFKSLFQGNDKLINSKDFVLPAKTLSNSCYHSMFYGCKNLIATPELPAIKAGYSCYESMFRSCTSLITMPNLPATTLAGYCYYCMFRDCTNLTATSKLPATILANSCYNAMFYGCANLVNAPELPSVTLVDSCYRNMFNRCSSLRYIKMLATDISSNYCLANWVSGVATNGTFVKNKDATWDVRGADGIPEGWTVITE